MAYFTTMTTVDGRVIRLRRAKPGPKPLPAEVRKRRVNIAISPHWHEVGKRLASERGVSFSRFLEELVIYQDSLCNESG